MPLVVLRGKHANHPKLWRTSTIVVLRKPGKPRYDVLKAYRPIALLNCLGKVLEKIVRQRVAFLTQEILPAEQFGSRHGYSAPDAVLQLTHDNSTEIHQGGGTTILTTANMIDIQGAFDNVHRDTLLTTLQEFGLPSTAIR
jgi:hypothetical protein